MSVSRARSSRPANRRERRLAKQQGENGNVTKLSTPSKQHLTLKDIKPLTDNQKLAFEGYFEGQHLFLHGIAGTGKTFLGCYLALTDVIDDESEYNKVVILRSAVQGREQGFMPGSKTEKQKEYELPYTAIFSELFGRGDAYSVMKNKGMVEFETTSFIRGITFNQAVIVVDEVQNMSAQELSTIITRCGADCRIIFCGDFRQSDLIRDSEKKGLGWFMRIIKTMKSFDFIDFQIEDIVRSKLCKEFIIAQAKLEDTI